jgi:hypothetical protein
MERKMNLASFVITDKQITKNDKGKCSEVSRFNVEIPLPTQKGKNYERQPTNTTLYRGVFTNSVGYLII